MTLNVRSVNVHTYTRTHTYMGPLILPSCPLAPSGLRAESSGRGRKDLELVGGQRDVGGAVRQPSPALTLFSSSHPWSTVQIRGGKVPGASKW